MNANIQFFGIKIPKKKIQIQMNINSKMKIKKMSKPVRILVQYYHLWEYTLLSN